MGLSGVVTTSSAPHTIRWTVTGYDDPGSSGYPNQFTVETNDGKSTTSTGDHTLYTNDHAGGTTIVGNATVFVPGVLVFDAGSASVATPPSTLPPPTPSAPLASRIEGGIIATWGSSSGAIGYVLRVRRDYDNFTTTYSTSSTSYSVTGLQFGVTHHISVYAYNSYGSSSYSSENPITTAPQTPTIFKGTVTNSSITIIASTSSANTQEIQVERYTSSSSYIDTLFISGNSGSVTWHNLLPGTTYIFKARSKMVVGSTTLYSVNYSNNLVVQALVITEFSWTTAKIAGQPCIIYAEEWNRLMSKINEFRSYKGLPTITWGATVAPGNQIYANAGFASYNRLRNAIAEIPGVGALGSTKNTGDIIMAADIDKLRTALNAIL